MNYSIKRYYILIFLLFSTIALSAENLDNGVVYSDTSGYEPIDHTTRLNFSISYSAVNLFQLKPIGEFTEFNFGFEGFSGALNYVIDDKNFLSFTLSAAGFDREEGDFAISENHLEENIQIYSFSVVRNFIKGKFSYGYGGSAVSYYWSVLEVDNNNNLESRESSTGSLGMIFSGYYNVWQQFHVGIFYQPTVFRFWPEAKLQYEHIIGLDILVSIY